MKIGVGSENPNKVKSVESVMKKIYAQEDLKVVGLNVNSKISSQPFNEETIKGAINRAGEVMNIIDADLAIGIEAGLFSFPFLSTNYLDIHLCAIQDKMKKITIGSSCGFELPQEVINRVLQDREVGDVMDEFVGMKNIGKKMGAIGIFSKGLIDRSDLVQQAVLTAMIPRISKDFYFSKKNSTFK
ncbi:inosine/xanthosine triphosphatase [[Eubacterium] cellulosolvens]